MIPKPKTYRNRGYLAWIKGQPCLVCGKPGEACHVRRSYWGAGMGKKPHDYCTIPLCREHHSYKNEREYGTERVIIDFLMKYIEEGR